MEESNFIRCDGGEVNINTGRLRYTDVHLKIKELPINVVKAHNEFFVCAKCGKVFYEGSHWDRYLGKRRQICEPR